MELVGFTLLCSWSVQFFSSVHAPASGRSLQPGSPGRVFVVSGDDAVLPCRLDTSVPSRVMTLEWSRVDGPSPLTVHVLRDGKELAKEKSAEYLGRTDVTEDGSLKLRSVTRWDSGTYSCVLLGRSPMADKVFVSLTVAEVSEVDMTVQRTSSNELFVRCESSGWSPEPLISLLDASGDVLPAQTESSVGPDNLHSVRAHLDLAAMKGSLTGSRTLICRAEIPETSLVKQRKISIRDQFNPPETGLGYWVIAIVVVVIIAIFLLFYVISYIIFRHMWMKKTLPRYWQYMKETWHEIMMYFDVFYASLEEGDDFLEDELFTEYGNICKMDTKGASEETARANQIVLNNGQLLTGVKASRVLVKRDLEDIMKYDDIITVVGKRLRVHPALIAAIISRQSQAGTKLDKNGFGPNPDCFGLMQINTRYQAVKGNPYSTEHIDQGVTFLIQLLKTMERMKPNWTKEQRLKGALACYVAGEDKIIPLENYEDMDNVDMGMDKDFADDVIARAKWMMTSQSQISSFLTRAVKV